MVFRNTLMVTGGAGFIGSALVAYAVRSGAHVIVVDALTYAGHEQNLRWMHTQNWSGNYTLEISNVLDTAHMLALMKAHHVQAVIHAAAESHVDNSIAGAAPFMETNVQGTQSMLDAARHYHASLAPEAARDFRFLQVSTDEVYGALGSEGAFTLSSPLAPNSPYAASKAAADLLVRAWHTTYGLPTLITRCCNNYGPRQHPEKLIPRMITQALAGEDLPVYGAGDQVREWIHVDDHARGVFAALARGEVGSVSHLGSGAERMNISIVRAVCALLSRAKGGDFTQQIRHVADRLGHDFRYALDVSETQKALGFSAEIALEEGLASTVNWYLEHTDWTHAMNEHTNKKRSAA